MSKPFDIFKPGSSEYYADILDNIVMVAHSYDGYDTNNPIQMKELVDELKKMAISGLNKEPQYRK